MTVRAANPEDVERVAELHARRIDEGFLSSLGIPFLRRLYQRVLRSPDSFVLVDDECPGAPGIAGFIAGVEDLGALYRRFIVRDGVIAGLRSAPRLLVSIPRVVETLRYPSNTTTLPAAEILAVAVAEDCVGVGVGRALVRAATAEFHRRGVPAAKVVTTTDNAAALAMYRGAGFVSTTALAVHPDHTSEVLVWTAS